jgi:hypothetical protein
MSDFATPSVPWPVYISYRRQDAEFLARAVYDRLSSHFGYGQVFIDVDSIELGDDFVEVITRAVTSCNVLLALIGLEWASARDYSGRRRIDDPSDFVRMEIEAALEHGVQVIPVLSEGARLPLASELPPSLAPISRSNAVIVRQRPPTRRLSVKRSGRDFYENDIDQLIIVIDRAMSLRKKEQPERPNRKIEEPHPVRVFLCHSSSDKPVVRTLYGRLLQDGIKPWLDEEDILPGQNWSLAIQRAIRSSDIILVCLSRVSLNKVGYLQREITEILQVADEHPEDSIFVIPARLEPCDVPERFRRLQWVDLFEEIGYDRLMRSLRMATAPELRH